MVVGTPIHRSKMDDAYDSIVIGSGMGGLSAAAFLAKAGQKVLVLEKHYTAGGFTHVYERKGYEWDVGVHYIGEVHRKNSVMRRIFDYISNENLDWAEMDQVYDRIILGDESFDYVAGRKNFRERMVEYFPKEAKGIDEYLAAVQRINIEASLFFIEKTFPNWAPNLLSKKLAGTFRKYASMTTYDAIRSFTKDEKLIGVLSGQWGDYGLPPQQSSFAMHAAVVKHYLSGAAYPVGGSSSIAKTIIPQIDSRGGAVVTGAEVVSIEIVGGAAEAVKLKNGRIIKAKRIISGVGIRNTFKHLLDSEIADKLEATKKVEYLQPSMAHIGIYIGLKGSSKELGLKTTNLWVYPDEQHEKNVQAFYADKNKPFPVVYISFPSSKDPEWEKNYPGKSTIEIVAPVPYEWFSKWENTKWGRRGQDYKDFKEELSLRLLETLYEQCPQVKGKIDYWEASSPLSTAHFCSYDKGQVYGIDHSPLRYDQSWLKARTPIKNLFLTGQDIVSCGVGGALVAGALTAISVLGPLKSRSIVNLLRPAGHRKTA